MFVPERPKLKPTSLNYKRYMFNSWEANGGDGLCRICDIYDDLNETYLSTTGYIEQKYCNVFTDDEVPIVILTAILNEEFADYTFQVVEYVRR